MLVALLELDVDDPFPAAPAAAADAQFSALQPTDDEDEEFSPAAAPELDVLFPPDEEDVLATEPSEAQPEEEAAPPGTLFSASASHSLSPEDGPEGSEVEVDVGAADVEVAVLVAAEDVGFALDEARGCSGLRRAMFW